MQWKKTDKMRGHFLRGFPNLQISRTLRAPLKECGYTGGERALGEALCWLYAYDISFTIADVHTLHNHYNILYGMCRERRCFQWRRQDLLRGGAKMEIMSWGTHGELQGRVQQLLDD